MPIPFHREEPTLRDEIAIAIAAALIEKTDLVVDYKSCESDEISFRQKSVLSRVAEVAYHMADRMIVARRKS